MASRSLLLLRLPPSFLAPKDRSLEEEKSDRQQAGVRKKEGKSHRLRATVREDGWNEGMDEI